MKMTPLGPRGRHRDRMNGKPIVIDLCDSASQWGVSSPVGGESERYYDACVNQITITLWPLAAVWGSFGCLFIRQQQYDA